MPATVNFFSGNPSVELTKGILYIYKDSYMTSLDKDVPRSEMLCMMGVPASYTIHDLIQFVAPMRDCLASTCSSIEAHICHLVYVSKIEIMTESEGGSLPIMNLTELLKLPSLFRQDGGIC
ncbi:hypothetical protein Btru_001693 [Bulinus truncatus]|nr:hypothetical protein Btru_001693 [Bulinus truncatus]